MNIDYEKLEIALQSIFSPFETRELHYILQAAKLQTLGVNDLLEKLQTAFILNKSEVQKIRQLVLDTI